MPSAQDTAFSLLAREAGVLSARDLQRAEQLSEGYSANEPLVNVLIAQQLLSPKAASGLMRQLTRATFVCARCSMRLTYDQLSSMATLECPDCQVRLAVDKESARLIPQPSSGRIPAVRPVSSDSDKHRRMSETVSDGSDRHKPADTPSWDARATVLEKKVSSRRMPGEDTYREPGPAHGGPGSAHGGPGSAHGGPGSAHGGPGSAFEPPAPASPPRKKDRTLGNYTLIKELGRGSNGVVYLAKRKGLERRFALKVLLDAEFADEETIARFKLEAAICSKLGSPGIVSVYDVGTDDRHHYFAMEFCEGLTLREKISEGPMAPREAATLIAKLARTLAHAHEAGVLHRDLKPANIILAPDHPKITDFGLARDRSLQRSLTKTGDLLGTPYYMAPELFREGAKDLGHHLDIYSLGVVLYECLTGVRPFQAATPMLLAQRICRDQPTRPSELNPSVSPGLDAICKLAMAKKPGDRYVNMREFADDLELDLRGKSPMASQDISRRRKRPGTARGGRRNTILMASAAIAIALPLVTWFTVNTVRRNARHAAARELLGRTDAARADLERAAGLAAGDDALLTLARHALRKADARVRLEEAAQLAEREPPPALAVEGRLEEAATLADGDPAILREVKAIRRRMVARIALVKARRSSKEPGFHEEVAKAFEQAIGLTLPPDRELLELERLEYFYVHGRQEEVCALAPLLERNDTVGPRAMFFHALALEEVGRVDEMRRLMERLAEDKTTAIGLTAGAFLAFIADDFRGALRLSDAAVEIDASFPPTVRIQALALVGTGQAEQAEMRLKTIEDVAGDWPRVLRLKLILHSKLGRTRDALRAAERMVEMSEPTPTAHALASCGQARMMLGDHASAIPYFDRALTVDETLINSRVLRGLAYHLGRQTQRAVTDWRKADASNPAAFEASLQEINPRRLREDILSLTRGQQGPGGPNAPPISFGEVSANAVTVLETRWNRAPQAAQKALEQALRKAAGASQWWELKKIFDAARDAAPDSGVVALERVRALVGRTANTEALAAIRAARKTDASPHELDRLRAETLLFSGDTPEALSAFQAVAQADPSGLNGHCASAEAALIQRNFKKADAEARAALEIDPKHVPSMILRVFAMNTQPRQALQIARQAFDLEGLMNSRLFLAHSLASIRSLMMNLLRGRSDPREGMKVMTDTRALFDLSEGAYSRLLLCDEVLRVRLPFAFAPLTAWIEQQLKAAEAAEPDRAHVHVLLGTMQLTGGGSAESVIKAWQKAKALDPKADLGPWTSEFDRRFGATPELKALLR